MASLGVFQLIGFVIAAIIAFWVGSDANKRGMNGILWGIGTFLLCIVFLPLYLIIRKPLLVAGQVPQGTPIYIPPPPHGQYPPTAQPPAQYPPPPPPQFSTPPGTTPPPPGPPVHFCTQCGHKYEGTVKFCPSCGAPQS